MQSPRCPRPPLPSRCRCPQRAWPHPTTQSHCPHARSHTPAPPRPSPVQRGASRSDRSRASARHRISSAPNDHIHRRQSEHHETLARGRSDQPNRPSTKHAKINPTPGTSRATLECRIGEKSVIRFWGKPEAELQSLQQLRPKVCGKHQRQIGGVNCGPSIAPMTRARNRKHGSGSPPIIQLLLAAVLRVFVSLVQGARTTLQMWWRKGQRDWNRRSETSAVPTATSGIHLQERNHTCRSQRPQLTRSAAHCALRPQSGVCDRPPAPAARSRNACRAHSNAAALLAST